MTIYAPSHDPQQAAAAHAGSHEARSTREPDGGEQSRRDIAYSEHTYIHSNDDRYGGRYDVVMMRAAANGPIQLLNRGLLAMTVPDKPRSKPQRYILTDEGRAYLRHLTEGSE